MTGNKERAQSVRPLFDRYVEACNYPGVLDEAAAEAALIRYVGELGIHRTVRRLRPGWRLATEPALRATASSILDQVALKTAPDHSTQGSSTSPNDPATQEARLERFAAWCVQARGWGWYNWELSWLATTAIGAASLGTPIPWADAIFDAFLAGAWLLYWTKDALYWVAKPTLYLEGTGAARRLHREDGPAFVSDVEPLYFWHGVLVPRHVVESPGTITDSEITQEPNAEVRRVMLARYGEARYIEAIGAKPLDRSDDGYILYRSALPDDEDLVMVKVINSTPEPDGTKKPYWLRVHPELRPMLPDGGLGEPQEMTAHNAVASTFGLRGEEYILEAES